MRILGIDYGSKRIGIAISDELGITAQTRGYIERAEEIGRITEQEKVEKIIVGHPLNMDGTVGPAGKKSEELASHLKETLSIPVELWDERLTTRSADRILIEANLSRKKRKKKVDQLAAQIMLQNYLDSLV